MCGIAGAVHTTGFSRGDISQMLDSIAYRGPDAQAVVEAGPALLGNARLEVVDLAGGGQPMANADETVWVVCNGEIYNFVELREELEAKGYRFKSRSDTEVLVHLWRDRGPAMLQDLIGMFAFCLWDKCENRGILARDRHGLKPCYVMETHGGLVFASEIKAILGLPGVDPAVDEIGLNLVHSFNYCLPPRTCYEGVSHLEPGCYLEFNGAGSWQKHRYWTWSPADETSPVDPEAFGALLDDAVRLQMRFDVKGCMFLSGGVDSSIIAAHLRDQWNEARMMAFGLDCRVEGFSEFGLAQSVADMFEIDLHPVTYDHTIVPDLQQTVLHHTDQPHGDFSFFLFNVLCRAARDAGAVVAFNGDGPDEFLGGYNRSAGYTIPAGRGAFGASDHYAEICFMPDPVRDQVLTGDFRRLLPDPGEALQEKFAHWHDLAPVNQVAGYESTALLCGNNLIKTDRMGSAASLEGRSPFLDHRVAEMLSRVPVGQKIVNGVGKHFLKEYGLRFFDRDHMFRGKTMPTMPIGEWIKDPLRDWAHETLKALDPGRYDVRGAMAIFDEHVSGRVNHTRPLRTLLMSSAWLKQRASGAAR